ncbi:MAG: translation initiation factor IF-2 subunit gamma [Candidatus Aenigmarchaeota archaeon]|nr:translation initiation factor IF-2 subunit gamma [Candidatus Aenigmarchaeota archaeon]
MIPEVNIGLVGHVDHGKTTLTEMLSGKWTDTHSEEIKRGISIRLGYADMTIYKCPKCKPPHDLSATKKCIKCFSDGTPVRTVSFVDAPGHEMLMATVLSGAALMDGALLLVASNEECPQPQTKEHLTTLDIVGIKNIVIVQTKIDLVDKEQALKNYKQIKEFVKGTVAENAPIVPISAKRGVNIDVLIKTIEEVIPTPKRDSSKPPKFLIARSFDTNKPGTEMEKISGGVIGGSLVQGKFRVGDEIEIKPGIIVKEQTKPVKTKITGLHKAGKSLDEIEPGGLIGLSTSLDPYLTKSDSLSGSIAGLIGKLPEVLSRLTLKVTIMERVVGAKDSMETGKIKTGDPLMITVGTMKTTGAVTSAREREIEIRLKTPICAERGERIVISKLFGGRWRLIGYGELV